MEAKHAVRLARDEACRLGHSFAGPQELLLGLLAQGQDPEPGGVGPGWGAGAACEEEWEGGAGD